METIEKRVEVECRVCSAGMRRGEARGDEAGGWKQYSAPGTPRGCS